MTVRERVTVDFVYGSTPITDMIETLNDLQVRGYVEVEVVVEERYGDTSIVVYGIRPATVEELQQDVIKRRAATEAIEQYEREQYARLRAKYGEMP